MVILIHTDYIVHDLCSQLLTAPPIAEAQNEIFTRKLIGIMFYAFYF